MHAAFAAVFAVSFIIGICTLLLGCNPHIEGQCIAHDIIDGTVYGYKYTTDTCSQCNAKNSKGQCISTSYYDCYDAYVRVQYGHNATCLYATATDDKSQSHAQSSATHYPIGDELTLVKRKGTSECIDLGSGMNIWITGVAFLSFCALVLLVWLVIMALSWYSDYREAVSRAEAAKKEARFEIF